MQFREMWKTSTCPKPVNFITLYDTDSACLPQANVQTK